MKMSILRRLAAVIAALACVVSATALDLPVKTLKGTKYYYYKVKKNETVYGVSKKLGLTRDEIVSHNPAADDGIKKGMVLYFPYDEYAPRPVEEVVVAEVADTVPVDTVAPKSPSIVLMLPFGLDNAEPSRRNKLALDFYKGFLMAADTLASRKGAIELHAIDTDVDEAAFKAALQRDVVRDAAVIVAPDNDDTYRAIADAALDNDNYVLNVFLVADSLYAANPRVLQANIPQRDMYRLAADAFEADYGDYIPVILRSNTGRNEKEPFVTYLVERCRNRGVTPIEISYENNLVSADIEGLDVSNGQSYVFVPSSGSLAEFNKFAYVVKSLRDRVAMTVLTGDDGAELPRARVAVFGYPDWTAFRGDALDTLQKLEATVYSRFFDNFGSFDSRTLQANFRRWYGQDIIESIPSQAMLGYDTGCFLIKNLRANEGTFDPLSPRTYTGLQSTFDFDKSAQGYYNSVLYIIRYAPDGTISQRVI